MWTFLWYLILCIYIPASLGLIVVVLLQKGKGVGFAGAFGVGGGSETVFGPRSSKSLPQKLTYTMAGLFMSLALIMSMLSDKVGRGVAPEEAEVSAEARAADLFENALTGDLDAAAATPAPEGATAIETPGPAPAEAAPAAETPAPAEEAAAPAEAAPAEETPAPVSEEPAAPAEQTPGEQPQGQ